jgi:hypothetical protein
MAHIRSRLTRLEKKRRFLDWFVWDRILDGLTEDELRTYLRDGHLPEPIPNRPSRLDTMDRKTLNKLWEENERIFAGRSHEELEYFTENGHWPQERGWFHYLIEDGKLVIEWRSDPDEPAEGMAREPRKER